MNSIAIDGPSGAGKSSLSRKIAEELGYIYVDTGALYRSIGLAVLQAGKNTKKADEIEALLPQIDLALRHVDGEQRVFLGSEDVSEAIREEAVSMAASDVSAHPAVRAFLLETQRRLARENNVIMDGRDIGTVVLPNANIKIYLTATVEDRAMRRTLQLREAGKQADYETVKKDVEQRDYNDSHRAAAPLKQADDAVLVDTTGLEFEQSLALLLSLIKERLIDAT
ncbi:(d)CMP kinase [Ruminococcaceae bacterium OttesenSCG-928-A16]|nr:(d)CMP kinase [Ruminococcaceae bacterium OttesenSCG-928-A16]